MMGLSMIRSVQNASLVKRYMDEHPDETGEIVDEVALEYGWIVNEDGEWTDGDYLEDGPCDSPLDSLVMHQLSEKMEDAIIEALQQALGKVHPQFVGTQLSEDELIGALRKLPLIEPRRMVDGYVELEAFFVDSSGFGQPGEPALTLDQFAAKAAALADSRIGRPTYFALTEAGQFQVHVSAYRREGDA